MPVCNTPHIYRSSFRWKQLLISSRLLISTMNSFKSMILLYTYDWLLVKNWLNINVHTEAHIFSLPNDCLWYDKLWGPSQRVVTLLLYIIFFIIYYVFKEMTRSRPGKGAGGSLTISWSSLYFCYHYFSYILFFIISQHFFFQILFSNEITRSRSSRELGGVWQYHDSRYCFFATTIYRSC